MDAAEMINVESVIEALIRLRFQVPVGSFQLPTGAPTMFPFIESVKERPHRGDRQLAFVHGYGQSVQGYAKIENLWSCSKSTAEMSSYTFIDGANFRLMLNSAREYFKVDAGADFNFNLFFGNEFRADRVFYYDALPAAKPGQSADEHASEVEKVEEFFDRLNRCDAVHVKTGVAKHRKKRNAEQKGVDILLALDAFRHALGGLDGIGLFTSDGDFFPILEALQNTRARTSLFCNPRFAPSYLTELADYVVPMNEVDFAKYFFASDWSRFDIRRGSFASRDQVKDLPNALRVKRLTDQRETIEIWTFQEAGEKWLSAVRADHKLEFRSARSEAMLIKLIERDFGFYDSKEVKD